MQMEYPVVAPADGEVKAILVEGSPADAPGRRIARAGDLGSQLCGKK